MDYKGHKLYLQNKDGKFEEFTYEMAIETIGGQSQVIVELQNKIDKAIEYIYENAYDEDKKYAIDDIGGTDLDTLLNILKGSDNIETNNNN